MGKGSGTESWRLSFRKQSASVGNTVAPVRRRERGARLPGNARERMLSETGCGSSYTQAHSHAEEASYSERLGFKFKSSRIFHCLTRSASPGRTIKRSWERGCGGGNGERVARVYRRERPTLRAQSQSDQNARRGNIHSVTDFLITPLLLWINTANNRLGICFAA